MDHSKDRFHNNSNPQPNANAKDELDEIKDEEDMDADVEDDMAVKEDAEEGKVVAAGLGGDAERLRNGAGDGESEHDVLPSALKEEVDDGVV